MSGNFARQYLEDLEQDHGVCQNINCNQPATVRCEMGMWLCQFHFETSCGGRKWQGDDLDE